MGSFDDMPGRGLNHAIEEQAETAFRALLAGSAHFILQQADLKDYGRPSSRAPTRGHRAITGLRR